MSTGLLLCGFIEYVVHRETMLKSSFIIVTIFGLLSAIMNDIYSLALARFLTVVGIGISKPPMIAMLLETTPS